MNRVSIIIPVIRPKKANRCIDAIRADGFAGEILHREDTERIGCPKMVEALAVDAEGGIICFLGDDTIPRPGWLQAGLDKMATLPDGWGVVGLRTEGSVVCAHWLADKRMLPLLGGQFFSTEYEHNFCDNELMDIAIENGRWAATDEVVIDHDHFVNGCEVDEDHKRVSIREAFERGRKIYIRRKRERLGKIAIGFPLVDPTVPVQFLTSFCCIEKPSEYTLLTPQFPHGPWSGSIADARNSIVEQARQDGAKWLLMCDTDQVYPHDTLTKLLQHGKDICGVRVHRRWPPFDPIFYRGELGKYLSVSDEEAYSGDLIDVDATGTGCLLLNMEIFDHLEYPWFRFDIHEGNPVGEDIFFCSRAKAAGLKIFIDTSIEVGHLTTLEVGKTLHQICKLVRRSVNG